MERWALVDHIREVYPDLTVTTVRQIHHGWSNTILVVNEELVFRFPRQLDAMDSLVQEVAILHGLAGRMPLPIPDPIYTSLTPLLVSHVFMGYRLIPGVPLWRPTLTALDLATQASVARQLGAFLRELHAVPIDEAIAIDLPLLARRDRWTALFERIRERLFPLMRSCAQRHAIRLFETFLGEPSRFSFHPVLAHRDFATSNILIGGTTNHVSGIIDFGSAGRADPAADCAGILSAYGEPFLFQFLDVYPELEAAFERARFYVRTFPLQDALAAAERGDAVAVKKGLAAFNRIANDGYRRV
jgi:aminoglycoside 2''-phosphotransferase